jgi:hypothetical protein
MVSIARAKKLSYGDHIYAKHEYNADGTPMRFKVNGAPKTWKKDPSRIRVPLKRGLYEFGYLDNGNNNEFATREPARRKK